MKAHIGVDSQSKIIHSVFGSAANVAEATMLPDLLHGEETRVFGGQAYRGLREVVREHAPKAQDCTSRPYYLSGIVDEFEKAKNRTKSKVRTKVEHALGVIKRLFCFVKVRYHGLEKNAQRLFVTCACSWFTSSGSGLGGHSASGRAQLATSADSMVLIPFRFQTAERYSDLKAQLCSSTCSPSLICLAFLYISLIASTPSRE